MPVELPVRPLHVWGLLRGRRARSGPRLPEGLRQGLGASLPGAPPSHGRVRTRREPGGQLHRTAQSQPHRSTQDTLRPGVPETVGPMAGGGTAGRQRCRKRNADNVVSPRGAVQALRS